MHDCGHGTLFVSRRANMLVGKFLGFSVGVDFSRFRQLHWEHHKRYGVDGDPQGFHYMGTSQMSNGAFAWHLLKPLFGYNMRYAFSESYLYPKNLKNALMSGEFFVILALQFGVLFLITGAGRHVSLALVPFVAASTFGLFFSRLRGLAEHGVRRTDHNPEGFVRSHPSDWLGRIFLYDVQCNFHEAHHRFPQIPSHLLPKVFERENSQGATRPNMWQTLKRMMVG